MAPVARRDHAFPHQDMPWGWQPRDNNRFSARRREFRPISREVLSVNRLFIGLLSLLLLSGALYSAGAYGQDQEEEQLVVSPFSGVTPEPLPKPASFDVFIKDWFAYPVTAGGGTFTPVYLPFKYTAEVANPDANQSYTFPQLLSFKVDWIPSNMCMRHPYFVFKRDRRSLQQLSASAPQSLAAFIGYWDATHAVGGTLHETAEGWSGSLDIYNARGQLAKRFIYKEARDYFKLMSDMALDACAFWEYEPSPGLKAELAKPLTASVKSLRLLGEAALAEERSGGEWALYYRILKIDPEFAEVRFWYANQKGWVNDNGGGEYAERVRALESRIVVPLLKACGSFAARLPAARPLVMKRLEEALALAPGSPALMWNYLSAKRQWKPLMLDDLESLVPIAQRYPGCGMLHLQLGLRYLALHHYAKAIPLCLSDVRSGFLYGTGGHCPAWNVAGIVFEGVGEPVLAHHCAAMAQLEGDEPDAGRYNIPLMARALHELCQFRRAAALYEVAYSRYGDPRAFVRWMACLYEGGLFRDAKVMEQRYAEMIEKDPHFYHVKALHEAYRNRAEAARQRTRDGQAELEKLSETDPDFLLYNSIWWAAGYIENNPVQQAVVKRGLFKYPACRRGFILLDLWEKRNRTEISSYLYETYTWLHPNDQWFAKAKKEYEASQPEPAPEPDVERVLSVMREGQKISGNKGLFHLQAKLGAMRVEWTIKRCLDDGDVENAERIASLYEDVATKCGPWNLKAWARVMAAKVAAAKRKAAHSAAAATSPHQE